MKKRKYILSGGGTGGHIFPAVAIADELRKRDPGCEILFVGASDRMEMEKVPAAGYEIKGLWISGLQRSLKPKNLLFPFKLIHSIVKSFRIIRRFKPDAVIGTGGYASAAVLYAATRKGVPTLVQEQNNYAGLTNKWLSQKVDKICVAFDNMSRFFPEDKLVKTGNPVRKQFTDAIKIDRVAACGKFGLNPNKKTVLVVGGSLGARSINLALAASINKFQENEVQLLWQTGKLFVEEASQLQSEYVHPKTFIYEMREAYEVADVVISRAGAIAISEICIMGKPSVFVPLRSAAEDHQTKNAMALVENQAGVLVSDGDAMENLVKEVLLLVKDDTRQDEFKKNIKTLSLPKATEEIVDQIEVLLK